MDSISVTIPAYNEEENIKNAIEEAYNFLIKLNRDFEIVIINDGSKDKTGVIAESLKPKYPQLKVYHHKLNRGFAGAIKSCYKMATKDLVYLAPADGQVKIEELSKFLDSIQDSNVVVGYRIQRPESFKRRLPSIVFHFLLHNLLGIKVKEISTCILYRKPVLDSIETEAKSAFLEAEIIYKAQKKGYKIKEVGINYYPRVAGKSKGDNPVVIIKTVLDLLRLCLKLRLTYK